MPSSLQNPWMVASIDCISRVERLHFRGDCGQIHGLLFLKRVDVAGDVEVVVVLANLLHGRHVAVLVLRDAVAVGVDDLGNVFGTQLVLILGFFKVLT